MSIPPTYLAHENDYRSLVSEFLMSKMDPKVFVERYFALWKRDRDAQWDYVHQQGHALNPHEQRLCKFLDEIFILCDGYRDKPEQWHELSETQLREEVGLTAKECWSSDGA